MKKSFSLPRSVLLVCIGLQRPQQSLKEPICRHFDHVSIMLVLRQIALGMRSYLEEVAMVGIHTEVIATSLSGLV